MYERAGLLHYLRKKEPSIVKTPDNLNIIPGFMLAEKSGLGYKSSLMDSCALTAAIFRLSGLILSGDGRGIIQSQINIDPSGRK